METVVLKPNVVPEVDCNSNPVSGDVQELVLRLELHSEQLRTRASAGGRCCRPSTRIPQENARGGLRQRDGSAPLVLDEVELLDVDLLGRTDDETWLYVSSKAEEPQMERTLSPLQWCRQVLDDPKWEVIRRSLCLRLKSASSLRRRQSPAGKARTPTFIPHLTRGGSPRRRSPRSQVDLTSPRVDEDGSVTHGYRLQDLTDVQVVARLQEENLRAHRYFSFINPTRCVCACVRACCHSSCLAHPGLRQDYASTSPILANRRSKSVSFPLSAHPDPEEAGEDSGPLLPQLRVSPLSHVRSFSSARDWRRSCSFLSAPPHPSAGLARHTPPRQRPPRGADKMRGSLPNLAGAPSNPSASLLCSSHSFDSPGAVTRRRSAMASPGLLHTRVQSVGGGALKATSFVSPTVKTSALFLTSSPPRGWSGIPLSKSSSSCVSASLPSILSPPAFDDDTPSPTPSSKVAQSACSLLTPPRSLAAFSSMCDRAWRDSRY